MATHSSILTWRILWTEEPGWLHTVESQRVGHNLETEQRQPRTLVSPLLTWLSCSSLNVTSLEKPFLPTHLS